MIQPTSHLSGFYRTDAVTTGHGSKAEVPKSTQENGDRLSSASTESLREALRSSSEVRPEVVERGRELAVDPTYPPRAIIEQLAKLMIESREPAA